MGIKLIKFLGNGQNDLRTGRNHYGYFKESLQFQINESRLYPPIRKQREKVVFAIVIRYKEYYKFFFEIFRFLGCYVVLRLIQDH